MTQRLLEREVARSTGDSLHTIRTLGFSLLPARPAAMAPPDLHLAVSCPHCGISRPLPCDRHGPSAMGECVPCDLLFDYRPGDVRLEPTAPGGADEAAA